MLEQRTWADEGAPAPHRVCFLYNAQLHQVLHSISIAAALARRPDFDVEVWATNERQLGYARELVDRLAGGPIRYALVGPAILRATAKVLGRAAPPKKLTLASLARRLSAFDAIVTPERTSIALKSFGVSGPAFVHTGHGAGDRSGSLEARLSRFDLALVAGGKTRARLERDGLIRPDASAIVGYPKFEAADAMRDSAWRPFANDRPVVLYNPHFREDVSSWPTLGPVMLEQFAAQRELKLIFAPHVRLFDDRRRRAEGLRRLAAFRDCPNIVIDLGSERSVDMTYTALADLYVGDASSQVYEYLRRPRPCLFLNDRGRDWASDESYAHWRFGPVAGPGDDLVAAARLALDGHARFLPAQRKGFAHTFELTGVPSSDRAAEVIATFVAQRAAQPVSAPAMQPARAQALA